MVNSNLSQISTNLLGTSYRELPGEDNGTPVQYSCMENPMDRGAWWAAVHEVAKSQTPLSNFTFTFHFNALEKEMATHSSVLAWRIPGTGEPGGLPSMGLHRVRHDWSDLAVAIGNYQTGQIWTIENEVLKEFSSISSLNAVVLLLFTVISGGGFVFILFLEHRGTVIVGAS